MKNIEINISNKIATLKEKFVGVCGNSDYVVVFDFDDEWKSHATKTARFKYGGQYTDVVFTGNECPMPIILDTASVEIGVYAGNLHTTTSACVLMKTCVLSGSGVPADPIPDVYNQIIDKIDAGKLKGEDGVSPSVEVSKSGDTTTIAITDASGVHTAEIKDGSKGADGAPGKDGKDGSDANVTAENIQTALGYTPVTPSDLAAKQNVLTDADKQSITKIGMTTGAAWTIDEQKAAREKMGMRGSGSLNGFSFSRGENDELIISYVNPDDETDTATSTFATNTLANLIAQELASINESLHTIAGMEQTAQTE